MQISIQSRVGIGQKTVAIRAMDEEYVKNLKMRIWK
jgi:hypothetical protein